MAGQSGKAPRVRPVSPDLSHGELIPACWCGCEPGTVPVHFLVSTAASQGQRVGWSPLRTAVQEWSQALQAGMTGAWASNLLPRARVSPRVFCRPFSRGASVAGQFGKPPSFSFLTAGSPGLGRAHQCEEDGGQAVGDARPHTRTSLSSPLCLACFRGCSHSVPVGEYCVLRLFL